MESVYLDILPEELLYTISSYLSHKDVVGTKGIIKFNFEKIFQYKYNKFYENIILLSLDNELSIGNYIKKDDFWSRMISDMEWTIY